MFGWLKKLLPQRASPARVEELVKEVHAALDFFAINKVDFGTTITNDETIVAPLLYVDDGKTRREAILGALIRTEHLTKRKMAWVFSQEGKMAELEHWFTVGVFPK